MSKKIDDIKQYLTNLPVLTALVSSKPSLLYVRVVDHALGALHAQINERDISKQYITTTEQ